MATSLASKRILHVGGIADELPSATIRAAFLPFGPVHSVEVPKGKGFAFVEYEHADDAEEAIYNMDGADLGGRTIKVSLAQQNQAKFLAANEAIWKSDDWFQRNVAGYDKEQRIQAEDAKVLKELD